MRYEATIRPEVRDWREICQAVLSETDSKRLMMLVEELLEVLEQTFEHSPFEVAKSAMTVQQRMPDC